MENNKREIKNICLVRLSAFGDVTLCVPVVNSIKRFLPDANITWIISSAGFEFLQGLPGVEFIVFKKAHGLKPYFDLYKTLKTRKFDCLLALQASWRANLIYPLINAPIKIGFDIVRARDFQHLFTTQRITHHPRQHHLDSYFSFLEEIGIKQRVVEWNLPIEEERLWASIFVEAIGSRILLINPSASKDERTPGIEKYIQVIKEAQKRWKLHIILTGGDNQKEVKIGKMITSEVARGISNLIGKTTIKQLAALIEKADAIISPDTAAIHLAVAANKPVIGLYAVAPPEITGPYMANKYLINRFPDAVKTILKRDPATMKWGTRVHTSKAMDLISATDIIEKLGEIFS
ncbi:MAG: hypothetical protein A3F16_06950 [Deltaproteobacteria bacterium RIFCSPHIGHO2_12_FULL_43_9]|nr:MAG: hypothetical protein A3F16_06950 [Deltaproteobacteria bacterium RIFCSPHIGHO2_12_FULL_43_9]